MAATLLSEVAPIGSFLAMRWDAALTLPYEVLVVCENSSPCCAIQLSLTHAPDRWAPLRGAVPRLSLNENAVSSVEPSAVEAWPRGR